MFDLNYRTTLFLVLSSTMTFACGGEDTTHAGPTCNDDQMACGSICIPKVTPNVESIHFRVIGQGCAGSNSCHTGSNPKEKLALDTPEDFLGMVNLASLQRTELNLIEPFEPQSSYLINKLRGDDMSEKSSTGNRAKQMPSLASALCEEVILVIEEWIRNGAQ